VLIVAQVTLTTTSRLRPEGRVKTGAPMELGLETSTPIHQIGEEYQGRNEQLWQEEHIPFTKFG
jgi:hypothetical protein